MPSRFEHFLCGICATPTEQGGRCAACGSEALITVTNGYLSEFPPQTLPCPGCGSTEKPVIFRGWVRLVSFVWWTREGRSAGYVCRDCARTETTKTLAMNTVLGWWSIPAFFFYGWRAIYHNWRSVWAAPAKPHEWGAISAQEFAADLRADREEAFAAADQDWLLTETPLGVLNETQAGLVLSAEGLYELLQASPHATTDELHRAFRYQAKQAHPDRREASREATEDMMRLNQAWEILSDAQMRVAYDWLEEQRAQDAVA